MIKSTSSSTNISVAAEDVRLLFNDPPTTTPALHLPSFTAHVILQAEVSLIDAIDNNQSPGFVSKATRWSYVVGLVVLDSVGRALGVDQEMATLAQKFTSPSRSTPPLTFASTSNSSSSSNSSNNSSTSSARLLSTLTMAPMTDDKAITTTPTAAAIHMTSTTPHMIPSMSTTNRTRRTASTLRDPLSCLACTAVSASAITSSSSSPSAGTGSLLFLRRSEGQRNLASIHSNVSAKNRLLSPSNKSSSSSSSLAAAAATAATEPRTSSSPSGAQELATTTEVDEYAEIIHHRHQQQFYHQRSASSPLLMHNGSTSHYQREVLVPFGTVPPVLAFRRRTCSSTARSASSASPSSPSAPFRRTCCTMRSAHQRRPWRL